MSDPRSVPHKVVNGEAIPLTPDEIAARAVEDDAEVERRAAELAALSAVLYRRRRALAYRDEMGAEQGDFVLTIGDVLDAILEQLAQMAAAGTAMTPEMQSLLVKRADIKARIPKPVV